MQWNHLFCSIFKIEREDNFLAYPAKCLYFLCKLFSSCLTEKSLETNFCQQHAIVIFYLAPFPLW